MRTGSFGVVAVTVAIVAVTATFAQAEDTAEMISRYRREHGLSSVKTDPQLTAIAERQAKAMAASGTMDHSVAGSFSSRMSGVQTGMAAENIAAGTHNWEETFRMWQNSAGHNANLLQSRADSVGFAVARNEQTRYKTFWAMVIAEKAPASKERKAAAQEKKSVTQGKKAAAQEKTAAAQEKKAVPQEKKAAAQEKKAAAQEKTAKSEHVWGDTGNPFSSVKGFVCKYLCN